MAALQLANRAINSLASGITTGATSLSLNDGGDFPSSGDFPLHVYETINGVTYREFMKCTARSTNTLTVVRAAEDSARFPAHAFAAGATVELDLTKWLLDNLVTVSEDGTFITTGRHLNFTGSSGIGIVGSRIDVPVGGAAAALATLTDVDTTGVQDGDTLIYDSVTPVWTTGAPTPALHPFQGAQHLITTQIITTDIPITTGASVADVSAVSGNRTVTLPGAASQGVGWLEVRKTDPSANTVTIQRAGTDLIEGGTSYVLRTQYEMVRFFSDGNGAWYVVSFSSLAVRAPQVLVCLVDPLGNLSAQATNNPATTFTALSDPEARRFLDLQGYPLVDVQWQVNGGVDAVTKVRLEYVATSDINQSTGWTTLLTTQAFASAGNQLHYETNLAVPTAAQVSNCLLRMGIYDGDGVADPYIAALVLRFHD